MVTTDKQSQVYLTVQFVEYLVNKSCATAAYTYCYTKRKENLRKTLLQKYKSQL